MKKQKRGKNKNKWDKYFLLTWRKLWIIVVAGFVSILLHNLIYGLFQNYFDSHGGDEAFFFIIVVFVLPIYFIICLIYTLLRLIKRGSR